MIGRRDRGQRLSDEDRTRLTPILEGFESRVWTLAVLLVAFAIVQGLLQYLGAGSAANNEANALRHIFDATDYVPETQREPVQATTVCYARAVHSLEWNTLGEGKSSPVVTRWAGNFRESLRELVNDEGPSFSMLLESNRDRELARRQRIDVSHPSIPSIFFGLMLVMTGVSVAWVTLQLPWALQRPRTEARRPLNVALGTLGILIIFVIASLLIAYDLDRPFSGVARVEPAAITSVEQDFAREYVDQHGPGRLPCDEEGRAR